MDTFTSVGLTTTPLSMMFIGIILAEIHFKEIFNDWSVLLVSAIRLLLIPLVTYGVLKILGFNDLVLAIPVVLSAMPAAANTAIVASRYNNDYQSASKLIFVTTLLSIFTIPIILIFLGY
jgi:predicted permease